MARAFQLVHIFPELTIFEAIASAVVSQQNRSFDFWSNAHRIGAVSERVHQVARIFGLEKKLESLASYLSQGEKKLLDIASAFALDPQVILLDEPTSGDRKSTRLNSSH